ncbi:MAG: hypothetical protein IJ548_08020 [Paludibacteraceae bacterium]|jgi:hypothetical protein|nr:hypothetical protein [Paludibacteraceae bacterium]MBQ8715284.1 hypothetical protein [Prevotella sp.]
MKNENQIQKLTRDEANHLTGGYTCIEFPDFSAEAFRNGNCSNTSGTLNGNCGCGACQKTRE